MNADQRRRIDAVIGRQREAIGAIRDSDEAFDRVIAQMRGVLDAIQAANRAQVEAIDAMLAAHDEAERRRRSDTH